ncbi:putative NodU family carbamoyl transferase [Saccharothrix saharensis]|uniref:Putative NodU family carbamoyl transferase n=1 Tax=Saccharothrix saharensis TaxID=571190 RepID=A0A543JRH4_9PSEU|nr:carbamoyltransferase C-terminal domain-containing protein [Saccharothrix saharensis]TQM85428.1 putative NodU family carbamoyl transferase [Saccharothrix saharensis]
MAEYVLSCYLTPPGEHAVLRPRHDQNISLWRRTATAVELVRLWEVERFSGQKHHYWPLYTPERARAVLTELLASEGLTLADIRTTWGTPGLPGAQDVPLPPGTGDYAVHSLAHLFSGLLMDSDVFAEGTIVAMAVDAAPDFVLEQDTKPYWYAGAVSQRGRITYAPVESPAPLYSAAEQLFGKEPGTLMALASASTNAIEFDVDRVTSLDLRGGRVHPVSEAVPLVESIVAAARDQLARQEPDPDFTEEENLQSAVMKVVQRACELIAERNVRRLLDLTGVDASTAYLSMSGGYALNCPTNTALLDRFGFRGLLAPPCANDSGQSYGLGLLGFHATGAFDTARHRLGTAYHGAEVTDLDEALAEFAPWVEDVSDFSPDRFVLDVAKAPLAWVDGAAEIGPRALCHRSLLGDPRSAKTKQLLNEHKQRQWWRPVAPVVLAEHAGEWFASDRPSPFMLEAVAVRPEVRDRVPAILHLDGSARHQTVTAADNPLLHRALRAFHDATGVPVLCNTSLNDRGEPIVDTAAEALTFCLRKGIAVAYVLGKRIALRVDAAAASLPPRTRRERLFAGQESDRDAAWHKWVAAGYTEAAMYLMTQMPQLRAEPEPDGAEDLNGLADYVGSVDPAFEFWVDEFRRDQGPGTRFPSGRHK